MSPDNSKPLWPNIGLGRLPYIENLPRLIRAQFRMPLMVIARKDNFDLEEARKIDGTFLRMVPFRPTEWNRFKAITGVNEGKQLLNFTGTKDKGLPGLLRSKEEDRTFDRWTIRVFLTNLPTREHHRDWKFLLLENSGRKAKRRFLALGWVKNEELLEMAEIAECVNESDLTLAQLRQEISPLQTI